MSHSIIQKYKSNNYQYIDIVRMSKYGLVTSYNKSTNRIILNISPLGKRSVNSIEPRDLYAMVINGHVNAKLEINPFDASNAKNIAEYMSAIFLKIFSKRYGLTGSFTDLIPQLRFWVCVYIFVAFFSYSIDRAQAQASTISKYNRSKIDIDVDKYDLSNISDFIKLLNDSGTFPGLNTYLFISTMIKRFGVTNLPMFEVVSRFCANMYTSTINGNSIVTPQLRSYHDKLYGLINMSINKVI
jgi:hypothetical protein